jgi:hypothetical protein
VFQEMTNNEIANSHLLESGKVLGAMLLISGSITYFWIAGSWRRPSHAARSGLLSAGTIAIGVVLSFWAAAEPASIVEAASAAPPTRQVGKLADIAVYAAEPWTTPKLPSGLSASRVLGGGKRGLLDIVFPWAMLALAGGIAIDRGLNARKALGIATAIFGVALLLSVIGLWRSGLDSENRLGLAESTVAELLAVTGLAANLVASRSSETLLAGGRSRAGAHPAA